MSSHEYVLVGVDDSEGGRAAVRYGASQAARLGWPLRLVHVWPGGMSMVGVGMDAYPVVEGEHERLGSDLLNEQADLAAKLAPGTEVSTVLIRGERLTELVDAADEAGLTVLGDQHRPVLDRVTTGSVLATVASRASRPVVAVPANWEQGPAHDGVVAAVKSCAESKDFVRQAMRIAAEQDLPLTLLHAWQLPMIYDEYISERTGDDAGQHQAKLELEKIVASAREGALVEVPVRVVIHHGQPARALIDASARADLLLLARRRHGFPTGHLGWTGRAVLREAWSPVEVLPAAAAQTDLDSLVLEASGAIVKGGERATNLPA